MRIGSLSIMGGLVFSGGFRKRQRLLLLLLPLLVFGYGRGEPDYVGWDEWVASSEWDEANFGEARQIGNQVCAADDPVRLFDDFGDTIFMAIATAVDAVDEDGEVNYMKFGEGVVDRLESDGVDLWQLMTDTEDQFRATAQAAAKYLCPYRRGELEEALRIAALPYAER